MSLKIPGLKIGHVTDEQYHTGCTVFLMPPDVVASVDIRGPSPGSRETTLLAPDKRIPYIHAIVFTGGSAFGLATADGVMQYLSERGIGHVTPVRPVPLVAASVIYDLFFSQGKRLPAAEMGYAACQNAREENGRQGNVGVGAGATVGKWGGFENVFMKGGFGLATIQLGDLTVGAAAVVNAVGDVLAEDGSILAGSLDHNGRWLAVDNPLRPFLGQGAAMAGIHTTLVMVATNARLTKVEANRLAQRAHDGIAIAVRPAHTSRDGDAAYAVGSGAVEASFDLVANAAVELVAQAIRNGVRHAKTVGRVPGLLGD